MAGGKYVVKVAGTNPELFVMVWLEDGILIQSGVQMTEAELRAALGMNHGRSAAAIDQLIDEARNQAA
jgi:hypothetical protein